MIEKWERKSVAKSPLYSLYYKSMPTYRPKPILVHTMPIGSLIRCHLVDGRAICRKEMINEWILDFQVMETHVLV